MALFDDSRIELTCPSCSRKFSERLGKLKANPKLVQDAMDSGTEKCAKIAKQTLRDVRDRMGF